MKPVFFSSPSEFRKWLEENHSSATELLVGFYKVNTGRPSMTWSQSVDEALCFGWIDGIRKSVDDERYTIRFTPRKPASTWSSINIKKVRELTEKGVMHPKGLEAFNKRKTDRSGVYSYEQEMKQFSSSFEKTFKASEKGWNFFQSQSPSYKRTAIHWIMSAKQEPTKENRLDKLIRFSEAGKRIY